jgi:hypothetical protein
MKKLILIKGGLNFDQNIKYQLWITLSNENQLLKTYHILTPNTFRGLHKLPNRVPIGTIRAKLMF